MLRILNAFRNKLGQFLNIFLPPKDEIFNGANESLKQLIFVAQRWEYGSRFNSDGFEYRRFIPAFKKIVKTVYFIPMEVKEKVELIRKFNSCTGKTIVFSVFQNLHEIPQDYFELSRKNLFLVNWYTDDDMHFDVFSKHVAKRFDLNITTFEPNYDRYKSIGANVFISQWGGIEGFPFLDNRRYLACFIGRMYGQRKELVKILKKEFGDLIFVHDTRLGHISEDKMITIYQNSWLAIDEPTSYDQKSLQIKARVFENSSVGCLVLTKPNPRILKYFDLNREILFWKDISELINIIKDCKRNIAPYKKMARIAYERANREHLYKHRFVELFNFIFHKKEEK